MPAMLSLPLGGVAPSSPSTAPGTSIKPAVETTVCRNWRRVNDVWEFFILLLIKSDADSGQNIFHDVTIHVGEPEPATLVQIRQPFVIDAKQMEDGCLQIVNVDSSGSESALVRINRVTILH